LKKVFLSILVISIFEIASLSAKQRFYVGIQAGYANFKAGQESNQGFKYGIGLGIPIKSSVRIRLALSVSEYNYQLFYSEVHSENSIVHLVPLKGYLLFSTNFDDLCFYGGAGLGFHLMEMWTRSIESGEYLRNLSSVNDGLNATFGILFPCGKLGFTAEFEFNTVRMTNPEQWRFKTYNECSIMIGVELWKLFAWLYSLES